jgi:hypothetical protein
MTAARSLLLNLPSTPRFKLEEDISIDTRRHLIQGTHFPKLQSERSGTFAWILVRTWLKSSMESYKAVVSQCANGYAKVWLTSWIALLGKMSSINPSNHFSSAWDVVACQQYKQLNYSGTVGHKSQLMLKSTCLNTAHIATTTFEDLVIQVADFLIACNQLKWCGITNRELCTPKGFKLHVLPWRTRPRMLLK